MNIGKISGKRDFQVALNILCNGGQATCISEAVVTACCTAQFLLV